MQEEGSRITINRPRHEVYQFWRRVDQFPRFLHYVRNAELTDDQPNERLAWRANGENLRHSGFVVFRDAPAGRGTEVELHLLYDDEPDDKKRIKNDLRRFKQLIETGDIVRSEGSPRGAGEGALNERPAQPAEVGAAR